MIKPHSNIYVFPMGNLDLETLLDETGMIDFYIDDRKMLVDVDAMLDHGEFCGAAEYFVDPKGVA